MRASRQPGWAARAASASATGGASAAAGVSRSLRWAARKAASAAASAKAGGAGERRVVAARRGRRRPRRWRAARRGWPAPARRAAARAARGSRRCRCIRQERPARQTGTSAPRREERVGAGQRRLPEAGEEAERRGGVGGAAADAGGDRERLCQAQRRAVAGTAQRERGAEHEVVGAGAEVAGEGAVDGEREAGGGLGLEQIAEAGEDHEAVEQVVAVGAAAGDVQREVDLGGGELASPAAAGSTVLLVGRPAMHLVEADVELLADAVHVEIVGRAEATAPGATGTRPRACGRPSRARRRGGR